MGQWDRHMNQRKIFYTQAKIQSGMLEARGNIRNLSMT